MFFSFSLFCLEWRNLLIPFRPFWTERNSSRSTTRIYLFIYLALFVRIMKITYLRWCDDISFFFSKFSIKEAIQRSESTSLIILRRLRIFERVVFKNNGIQSIKSEKINLLFSPSHRLSPFFFFVPLPISLCFSNFLSRTWNLVVVKRLEKRWKAEEAGIPMYRRDIVFSRWTFGLFFFIGNRINDAVA